MIHILNLQPAVMFGSPGPMELMLVLAVVLLVFGPKNLPKLANSMGRAITDFKAGMSGTKTEFDEELDEMKQAMNTDDSAEPAGSSTDSEKKSA